MNSQGCKQGKFWGETAQLFDVNGVSVHALRVLPGGFCSEHRHNSRINFFHVIDGTLLVRVWKDKSGSPDTILLEEGESTVVEAGFFHKFESKTGARILEAYWSTAGEEDIERRTSGGLDHSVASCCGSGFDEK